jgi:hypothetical protein
MFLLAPLPNIIGGTIDNGRDNFLTFNNDTNASNSLQEFCKWITGLLIISGISMPLTFYHCKMIELGSMIMSIIGGVIVYGDIIVFIWFFSDDEDENDDFNF